MMIAAQWVIVGAGLILVLVTVLPLLPTDERWIRIWDFPRLQIAGLLLICFVLGPFLPDIGYGFKIAFFGALSAALAWQLWRIRPYSPLHRPEVLSLAECHVDRELTLLISNVKTNNPQKQAVVDLVRRLDPDVVLLLETDSAWHRALTQLAAEYRDAIQHPRSNTYGLHLFSRLELVAPQVRFLLDPEIPSIKTGIKLRDGTMILLYGLHPRPPPRWDTADRDAELVLVGKEVRQSDAPAIVAGDLNDVAWSRTTRLFQEVSGLLDPRIGRGLYPTFNANWRLLRWPLDHVFFSHCFGLRALSVMGPIGSDHFPLFVSLCFRPELARAQTAPSADGSELVKAQRIIRRATRAQ